jgi:hypothetical protein
MKTTTYLYAAYGSNMNHAQMERRCPDARFLGAGYLKDHKLVFRRVADIEPCTGNEVPVGLWELTKACVAALDAYEGFPRLYTCKEVTVRYKKRNVIAFAYIMNDTSSYAAPSEYYFHSIAEGYEHCGLDTSLLVRQFKGGSKHQTKY